jgi:hypothetical protein
MGVVGLTFLLLSCEKDVLERGSGEKVAVIFAVNNEDYAADEAMRSFGEGEPETKVVPLIDDIYLYATLRPDTSEVSGEFRGMEESLAPNQRVFLAAYAPGGTSPLETAQYTYIGGKLVADNDEPLGVEPGTYDFVAYSYYKSSEDPATSNIDPVKDLVWGRQVNRTIGTASDAARTVTIKMTHKFSRATVNMKVSGISGATITALNVQLGGGKRVTLTVHDGTISPGADVAQTFGWSTIPASEVFGVARTVYPVASPTKVTIVSMTVRIGAVDHPVSNHLIEFNTALAVGSSYVLDVNLKHTPWAASNIYWDGSKMTFDVTHTNNKYYQGVYFQWGSLVGVAPTGGSMTDPILYIPIGGGNWESTPKGVLTTFGDPRLVPWETATSATNSASENFLHNQAFTTYTGDICKYINSAWRMPNAAEFGTAASYGSWISGNASSNAAGTGTVTAGRNYTAGGVFFPASGYGLMAYSWAGTNLGTEGYYWSGSAYDAERGRNLQITSAVTVTYIPRQTLYSVRCIRN